MRKRVRVATRLPLVGGCLLTLLSSFSGCGSGKTDEAGVRAKIDDLPVAVAVEGDWPWWRGPTMDNVAAAGQELPLQWSETENVLWRVEVPGRGHASPCVCGDRIFLPTADDEAGSISVLCFDRDSGEPLWQTEVYRGELPKIHANNSHASATAACDGERVYFPYQTDAEVRMAVLVHRVLITRLGGIRQTRNHPDELPNLAGPPQGGRGKAEGKRELARKRREWGRNALAGEGTSSWSVISRRESSSSHWIKGRS